MTEDPRYVLSGFVRVTDSGFALPCYRRENGGNAWHVAVTAIAGDKTSSIVRFEALDFPDVSLLDEPLRKSVAVLIAWFGTAHFELG